MTYQAALDWLYTQLPMFQRQGASAFKKDLGNTQALLAALGNPERRLRVIHIGGTNGKGSTAHLIAAALQADGSRVGLYTSPHYKDFRERIKINATLIPEQAVVDFLLRAKVNSPTLMADRSDSNTSDSLDELAADPLTQAGINAGASVSPSASVEPNSSGGTDSLGALIDRIQPSFFELTVAMAFDYFARQAVDWAVIEVGMGGRLDSTNVVDPLLSVITNISKDHTQFLGDTLAAIAYEKAGIIKANRPVVIGKTQAETAAVFLQKAQVEGAPILFADQVWHCQLVAESAAQSTYSVSLAGESVFADLSVQLHGPFQAENLQTALAALHELHRLGVGYTFDLTKLRPVWAQLQSKTYFIGRWQIVQQQPLVLLDSAHNEGGLQIVLARLLQLPHRRLHIVLGMVNDKELSGILPLFPTQATYYFVKADIPRGLDAASLAAIAATYGLHGQVYSSVAAGYALAIASAAADDIVFVGGSIFTVAEIL